MSVFATFFVDAPQSSKRYNTVFLGTGLPLLPDIAAFDSFTCTGVHNDSKIYSYLIVDNTFEGSTDVGCGFVKQTDCSLIKGVLALEGVALLLCRNELSSQRYDATTMIMEYFYYFFTKPYCYVSFVKELFNL